MTENKPKLITFLYHEVVDSKSLSGFQRRGALPYKHKKYHFINDLKIILENFKTTIDLDNLQALDNGGLILTFDDGGVSSIEIAKILTKNKVLGHFFITTSMINKKGFLSEKQIKEIRSLGHIIGTHSHTHPAHFRDLPYKEMLLEWKDSKKILEKILNETINKASVPGGDLSNAVIKSASDVGIKFLFTSEPNFSPYEKHGLTVFGRVCPKNTTSESTIRAWSKGQGFLKAQLIRAVKEIFRTKFKILYKIYTDIMIRSKT